MKYTQYKIESGEILSVWVCDSDTISANTTDEIAFIEGDYDVNLYLIVDGNPVRKGL